MKTLITDTEARIVGISKDDGGMKNACDWSVICPNNNNECHCCPARTQDDLMSHHEAVLWWEEQEQQ